MIQDQSIECILAFLLQFLGPPRDELLYFFILDTKRGGKVLFLGIEQDTAPP